MTNWEEFHREEVCVGSLRFPRYKQSFLFELFGPSPITDWQIRVAFVCCWNLKWKEFSYLVH